MKNIIVLLSLIVCLASCNNKEMISQNDSDTSQVNQVPSYSLLVSPGSFPSILKTSQQYEDRKKILESYMEEFESIYEQVEKKFKKKNVFIQSSFDKQRYTFVFIADGRNWQGNIRCNICLAEETLFASVFPKIIVKNNNSGVEYRWFYYTECPISEEEIKKTILSIYNLTTSSSGL